jgi:hypothetical protein
MTSGGKVVALPRYQRLGGAGVRRSEIPAPPAGYQTCNAHCDGVQTNHLVRLVNGRTPGRTVLCGLTRFDSAPGAHDADLPGWSMGGGVYGPSVEQRPCPGCWKVADAATR